MSLRNLVEDKARILFTNNFSSKQKLGFKLFGEVKIKILVKDTTECFFLIFDNRGYRISNCGRDEPDILIEGKESVLIELFNSLSVIKYLESEKKGDIKIEAKGFKGTLVVSKVKKLLGL